MGSNWSDGVVGWYAREKPELRIVVRRSGRNSRGPAAILQLLFANWLPVTSLCPSNPTVSRTVPREPLMTRVSLPPVLRRLPSPTFSPSLLMSPNRDTLRSKSRKSQTRTKTSTDAYSLLLLKSLHHLAARPRPFRPVIRQAFAEHI